MLTELLVSRQGSGELGLLSPALARLTTTGTPVPDATSPNAPARNAPARNATAPHAAARWVMLIAPPWIPYAPGLYWQGLALDRVLTLRVRQPPEVFWAMDETLRSGACAGVIAWAGTAAIQGAARSLLQRLHLLAGKQQAWAVLIRAARFRRERSPARLRLEIRSPSPATLQVEIFRNGWRGAGAVTIERRF